MNFSTSTLLAREFLFIFTGHVWLGNVILYCSQSVLKMLIAGTVAFVLCLKQYLINITCDNVDAERIRFMVRLESKFGNFYLLNTSCIERDNNILVLPVLSALPKSVISTNS